jgi:pimeloyl-ACP methyl ester carboxylesterase
MSDTARPVLLVHGAHAGAWVWDAVRAKMRAPTVALDLPGHGARAEPLAGVTFEACVSAVVDAAKDLPRLELVGHSMGVPVVLAAADRIGARLARLTLVAGAVPRPGDSLLDSFPFVPRMVSRLMLALSGETFGQPEFVARGSLLNGAPEAAVADAVKRFGREARALVTTPVAWSGKPPCPTTYVRCLRDKGALPPDVQQAMAARLGEGKVVALDTCHYPMLERPAELAAILEPAT